MYEIVHFKVKTLDYIVVIFLFPKKTSLVCSPLSGSALDYVAKITFGMWTDM